MMRKRNIIAITILLILGVGALAADTMPDANNLTKLEDYLKFAALGNAELKAKFEEWNAAVQQIPQVKSLPDPKVTYEVDTEVGTDMYALSIMQEFPWFGTLQVRGDSAAATANAAYKRYEAAKLKLSYEVKKEFYEYVYLASAVQIARENLELVKHFQEVALTKYQTSAASSPDVIRAQTELANLEYVLKSLEELQKPIVAGLNAILNRPITEELPWPEKPQANSISLDRNRIIEAIRGNNPELASLNFELEAAKNNVAAAKKRFYPDLGIGLQKQKGMTSMNGDDDRVMLMFSISLPLWRQNYRAAQLQTKADQSRVQQEKVNTENNIMAQAMQALYDFEDSARKIHLYGDVLIPKVQELVMNSETAYKAGTVDFFSLIDSQRMLLEYRLMYERALADNAQKLAELEMLAGIQMSTANK